MFSTDKKTADKITAIRRVRTSDFEKYIKNLGFELRNSNNKELLSVTYKNFHCFTVPSKIYQEPYDWYTWNGVKHPHYKLCCDRADGFVQRIKKGWYKERLEAQDDMLRQNKYGA